MSSTAFVTIFFNCNKSLLTPCTSMNKRHASRLEDYSDAHVDKFSHFSLQVAWNLLTSS